MYKITSVIYFVILSSISFAQDTGAHICSNLKSRTFHQQDRSNTLNSAYISLTEEYDVHFYFLDVQVERTSTDISGVVEIHAISKVAVLDTVLFELHDNLTINSILVNGVSTSSFSRIGSAVIVPTSFGNGDSFIITIDYTGTPPSGSVDGDGITNDSSPSWGNQVTWTLSEPFSAYEWWPCKQSLTDKSDSVYIFITTDTSNMAGSNGTLTNVVDLGNGTERYEWKSNHPIDYYLVSIAVGQYIEYNIYANPTGAPNPVLIQNFIYNNPSTLLNFQSEIDQTVPFMEYFSDLFGLYPFHDEKYGHCMAPLGGGMEHQTMTTQGWFESSLTAHELGHQWFGDHVTCASWADIWLNEGFASYADYLMVENFYPADKISHIFDLHDNVMSVPGGSVWCEDSLNSNRIFSNRLTYNKGSSIVHILRFLIDDDAAFFQILRQYQSDFSNSTARIADFKAIAESVTGMDFTNFFNEWLYGEGYPTYSVQWNKINDHVFLEITQTSSMPSITPLFTNDLEIKIVGAGGITATKRFQIGANNPIYSIPFSANVGTIKIDPNNWIINQVGSITENIDILSVTENQKAVLIYPNPANDILTIHNADNATALFIYDLKGALVSTYALTNGKNNLDIQYISKGTYIVQFGEISREIVVR